ncbi:hypothetical protein [Geodermatophilus sp. SYSU D01105]
MSASPARPAPPAGPRLAAGVEWRTTARGLVLAAPGGRSYCELEKPAVPLLDAMTGTATTAELTERFGDFVPSLLDDLRAGGYLADSPPAPPQHRITVTGSGVEFAGADRLASAMARLFRPLFTPVGVVLLGILTTVGLLAPAVGLLDLRAAAGAGNAAGTALLLLVLLAVITAVHELGHAVVLAHYGRRIGRVGFGLYWGGLSLYVDASEALLLETRARRVLQSGAGLLVEGALAGVFVLAAQVVPDPGAAQLLSQAAALAWIGVLLNATPLLQLDGYWMLSDLLDEPDLHRRALSTLARRDLPSRGNLLLAGYAVAGLLFGVTLLAGAVGMWTSVFGVLIVDLWDGAVVEKILAAVLLLPVVGLVLQLLVLAGTWLGRSDQGPRGAADVGTA